MIDIILLTGVLLSAGASQSTGTAAATPAAAPAPIVVEGRRICRVIRESGTRLGARRICGTQEEWDDADSEARRLLAEGRQRSLAPTIDGSIAEFERMSRRCARC